MASLVRHLRPVLNVLRKSNAGCLTRTYADAAGGDAMPLTFAAANSVFYDAVDVKQVDVPTAGGDCGILAKHVPILAVLKPGVVTVHERSGENKKIFVSSGTLCVNPDGSVQVLAEEAHPLENLDGQAAKDSLSAAEKDLASASEDKKGEAQAAVEVAQAIVRAIG